MNDGCPKVGTTSETVPQCTNAINDDPGDDAVVNDGCAAKANPEVGANCVDDNDPAFGLPLDDDGDGAINDGCPAPPATRNSVQGNFIGTTTTGAVKATNNSYGISLVAAASNCIGGSIVSSVCTPVAGGGNVVSGNLSAGIRIENVAAPATSSSETSSGSTRRATPASAIPVTVSQYSTRLLIRSARPRRPDET